MGQLKDAKKPLSKSLKILIVEDDSTTRIGEARTIIKFDNWTLDLSHRTLQANDGDFQDLTRAEFKALALLCNHPGEVMSRDRILHEIAHRDWDPSDRTVDVVVRRLRQKLKDDSRKPRMIVTSHCEGYLFAGKLS